MKDYIRIWIKVLIVFIGYLQFFEKIDRFSNVILYIYYVHTLEISGCHKSNLKHITEILLLVG